MARTNEKTESDMISCLRVGFTHVLLANYIKNIDNEFHTDKKEDGFFKQRRIADTCNV